MWKSRTKTDLIIEVWELLDCESVGAKELQAIEEAVRGRFGEGAVESPMIVARILADEGADLRHSEVLELDIKRRLSDRYDAIFRNILKFSDFQQAISTIKNLENLRKKFAAENDREGLRRVREMGILAKEQALLIAGNKRVVQLKHQEKTEIAEWFRIWLQTPELFEMWVTLRQKSPEFQAKFDYQ